MDSIKIGSKLEKTMKNLEGKDVWVPGVANGAMGNLLTLMAKHGLLSEEALKLLELEGPPKK